MGIKSHLCYLLGQKIHIFDDAEVDHIEQYWRGGKTIPANAQLTHRFCNRSRPLNGTSGVIDKKYPELPKVSKDSRLKETFSARL